jgi:hypothetical protein
VLGLQAFENRHPTSARATMAKNSVTDEESKPGQDDRRGERRIRDKMLDKTLADSFPTSDPLSSIPDPCTEDSFSDDKAA